MESSDRVVNDKAIDNGVSTPDPYLKEISAKLDKLTAAVESKKQRDNWDKFGIISSFFSSVVIAALGLLFTYLYHKDEQVRQSQETQRQELQFRTAQLAQQSAEKAQQEMRELQGIISVAPMLASSDPKVSRRGEEIIKTIRSYAQRNGDTTSLMAIWTSNVDDNNAPTAVRTSSMAKIVDRISAVKKIDKPEQIEAIGSIVKVANSAGTGIPEPLKEQAIQSLKIINEKRLSGLKPEVVRLANSLIARAKDEGFNLVVIDGYRSPAKQDSLYQRGMTNAKGGRSKHNLGLAFDIALYNNDGKIDLNNITILKKIGAIGKELGLTWGGDWKPIADYPHFQLDEK